MTYERKRDFNVKPTGKRNRKSYKQNSRTCLLPDGEQLIRVCKHFFLKTLDISDKLVRCTMAKKNPANKTESVRIAYVKHHIQSFPAVDSYYQRKNTQRLFLTPGLSINKLYDLY